MAQIWISLTAPSNQIFLAMVARRGSLVQPELMIDTAAELSRLITNFFDDQSEPQTFNATNTLNNSK